MVEGSKRSVVQWSPLCWTDWRAGIWSAISDLTDKPTAWSRQGCTGQTGWSLSVTRSALMSPTVSPRQAFYPVQAGRSVSSLESNLTPPD